MKMRQNRRFTLIEIMTVLGVILILIGGVFVAGPIVTKMNGDAKTKALLKNLDLALTQLKETDKSGGNYHVANSSGWYSLLYILWPYGINNDSYNDTLANCPEAYLHEYLSKSDMKGSFKDEQIIGKVTADDGSIYNGTLNYYYPVDAWEMPIVYKAPGKVNTNSFDLISTGANGLAGSGVDSSGKELGVTFSASGDGHQIVVNSETDSTKDVTPYFGTGDDLTNFKSL